MAYSLRSNGQEYGGLDAPTVDIYRINLMMIMACRSDSFTGNQLSFLHLRELKLSSVAHFWAWG